MDNGNGTVTDRATGLMWQRSGSPSALALRYARNYVARLNDERFAGHTDWRMPTLEELFSLLQPQAGAQGRYVPRPFDPAQHVCWSCDAGPDLRRENNYYLDYGDGTCRTGYHTTESFVNEVTPESCYVRAVRTLEPGRDKTQLAARGTATSDVKARAEETPTSPELVMQPQPGGAGKPGLAKGKEKPGEAAAPAKETKPRPQASEGPRSPDVKARAEETPTSPELVMQPQPGGAGKPSLAKGKEKPGEGAPAKETKPRPQTKEEAPQVAHVPEKVMEAPVPKIQIRAAPRVLSESDIAQMIRKHNFYLKSVNDKGRPPGVLVDNGNGTVTDRDTGLMWQKSGSSSARFFWYAKRYVAELNQEGFRGHRDWRLPTLEELFTLLQPQGPGGVMFISPLFDTEQGACWSSDAGADQERGNTYYLDYGDGTYHIGYHSTEGSRYEITIASCYVRAVRTVREAPK